MKKFPTIITFLWCLNIFLPLAGAEKSLANTYRAIFSGDLKGFENFAQEYRKIDHNRVRTLAEIRDRFRKSAPLLQLAHQLAENKNDLATLKALLVYLGQDPALAEHLPEDSAGNMIRSLLPALRQNLQALRKAYTSLQIGKVEIKGDHAAGKISYCMDGRQGTYQIKLVKRNNRWMILEEKKISGTK